MGHRLFYLSLLNVLILGSIQAIKPWQYGSGESRFSPSRVDAQSQDQLRHIKAQTKTPGTTVHLSQDVPDQGRPQGRLRGGGSR